MVLGWGVTGLEKAFQSKHSDDSMEDVSDREGGLILIGPRGPLGRPPSGEDHQGRREAGEEMCRQKSQYELVTH